jgi:hypothetical protein
MRTFVFSKTGRAMESLKWEICKLRLWMRGGKSGKDSQILSSSGRTVLTLFPLLPKWIYT